MTSDATVISAFLRAENLSGQWRAMVACCCGLSIGGGIGWIRRLVMVDGSALRITAGFGDEQSMMFEAI